MTRSTAEAEVREAVVARLRLLRPSARIIHEVNSGSFGPNRIDVMAVTEREIISAEIKSAKDKMRRAPAQIVAMKSVSHHSIIALHECHLIEKVTNEYAAEYCRRDGKHYLRARPDESKGATLWVYPERERGRYNYDCGAWHAPDRCYENALPQDALGLLWRDELFELCGRLRICVGRRATMSDMVSALRWKATGAELTIGICRALRQRKFAEADAPVHMVAA